MLLLFEMAIAMLSRSMKEFVTNSVSLSILNRTTTETQLSCNVRTYRSRISKVEAAWLPCFYDSRASTVTDELPCAYDEVERRFGHFCSLVTWLWSWLGLSLALAMPVCTLFSFGFGSSSLSRLVHALFSTRFPVWCFSFSFRFHSREIHAVHV